MEKFLNKIYKYIMNFSARKNSWKFLSFISFIESIFFPIPTDAFLIPMVLANRTRAFFLIFVTIIFSVIGGLFGYLIGYFLWENLSSEIFKIYPDFVLYFNEFNEKFSELGWFFVLIGGFTPFPFKIVTISSGILHLNVISFLFFSFLSRGARFFVVGYMFYKFGEKIKSTVETNLTKISLILTILFGAYIFFKLVN